MTLRISSCISVALPTFAEYSLTGDQRINSEFKGHSDSVNFWPELISEELAFCRLLEEPVASLEKCTPDGKIENQN